MDTKYIMEIPKQLREMFKNKKSNDYTKKIVANIPLQEQNLNHHTLEILAVLNYNYWCKDEKKKKELLDLYCKNDLMEEQKLREKYNPDNLFKSKIVNDKIEEKKEEVSILAKYLIELSKAFSSFYNENKIIGEESEVQDARVYLTY